MDDVRVVTHTVVIILSLVDIFSFSVCGSQFYDISGGIDFPYSLFWGWPTDFEFDTPNIFVLMHCNFYSNSRSITSTFRPKSVVEHTGICSLKWRHPK